MGAIPPLSLGPPVVRPLRMTVVRPFGNLTLMVLAEAVVPSRSVTARSAAASFFIICPFVRTVWGLEERGPRARRRTLPPPFVRLRPPRMITRTPPAPSRRPGGARGVGFSTAAGVRYTRAKAKRRREIKWDL